MNVHVLNEKSSVANRFLAELRDCHTQSDRLRFRRNMERLGELMAYEFSKTLQIQSAEITTPLDTMRVDVPAEELVLVTVLRAGIPFFQGFLNIFDTASSGFIGAFREESGSEPVRDLHIALTYSAMPNLSGKHLVLIDPMLATGKSLVKAFHQCLKYGQPQAVHFMSVISAPEGIRHLQQAVDHPGSIWTWAKDSHLNDLAYIVPGLGDAGDLSFGVKE